MRQKVALFSKSTAAAIILMVASTTRLAGQNVCQSLAPTSSVQVIVDCINQMSRLIERPPRYLTTDILRDFRQPGLIPGSQGARFCALSYVTMNPAGECGVIFDPGTKAWLIQTSGDPNAQRCRVTCVFD